MKLQAKLLNCPKTETEMGTFVHQWHELSIQEVYLLSNQIKRPHISNAISSYRGSLWIVIQTLLDTENGRFPLAVTDQGKHAIGEGKGDWLRMLCPRGIDENGISIADYRKSEITHACETYNPVGISLDFLRHFVFWEEIYENSEISNLSRSCFCDTCCTEFSKRYGLKLPRMKQRERGEWILSSYKKQWNEFASQSINELANELVTHVRRISGTMKTNLHLVPWMTNEFCGARSTHVGQDLTLMGEFFNRVSPMCYSPMLKRPFQWVSSLLKNIQGEYSGEIWPAIQSCSMYGTDPLSTIQFREMVLEAGKAPAAGVEIWPWETITKDQLAVLREIAS